MARRLGVDELLAKYRYDPLEAMIAEASDPSVDPEVRRSLHHAIAPYVYPKLKSLEAKVETTDLSAFSQLTGLSLEQLERIARGESVPIKRWDVFRTLHDGSEPASRELPARATDGA
jgi:hypothetical protein